MSKVLSLKNPAILLLLTLLYSAATRIEAQDIAIKEEPYDLASLLALPTMLINIDFRVTKDTEKYPLHSFSIYQLWPEKSQVLFCAVLEDRSMGGPGLLVFYCSNPADIEFSQVGKELCITYVNRADPEVEGCYVSEFHDQLIDWHKKDELITFTTFRAIQFQPYDLNPLLESQAVFRAAWEETAALQEDASHVSTLLEKIGLHISVPSGIGARERAAIVRFQQDNGLLATGFLSRSTLLILAK